MCTVDFFEIVKEIQYIHEGLYSEESLTKIHTNAITFASEVVEEIFMHR